MARRIELPKIPSGAHLGVAKLTQLISNAENGCALALKELRAGLKVRSQEPEDILWTAKRCLANVANW